MLIEQNGADACVPFGFTNAHSWRGVYAEPSFEPCGPTTLGDMRAEVERALTETFTGWKGGEFEYGDWSTAHLDQEGRCTDDNGGGRLASLVSQLVVMFA